MLCITMRKGEYFKIGEDITIQFEHLGSERVHLSINAPKEVPIVRGKVLERLTAEPAPERPEGARQDEVSTGSLPDEI